MTYQSLETFSKNWIFKRHDPKVEPQDLQQIGLLSELKAAQIWRDYISSEHLHPDHFADYDWLKKPDLLVSKVAWEKAWDSEESALPEACLLHFSSWGEDTLVFFCCHNELVFELPWGVFKRCWKAFLFLDNGPVLIGKKKRQAAQFYSNGSLNLLVRSH